MEKPFRMKTPGRTCPVCAREGRERGTRLSSRHLHELEQGAYFVFEGDSPTDPSNFFHLTQASEVGGIGSCTIRRQTKGASPQSCANTATVVLVDASRIPEVFPPPPERTDPFLGSGFTDEDCLEKPKTRVKRPKGGTASSFVKELIRKSASDEEIVAQVRETFPDYKAWKICCRVYRKQLGITSPKETFHSKT